jgi:hypothetical protein
MKDKAVIQIVHIKLQPALFSCIGQCGLKLTPLYWINEVPRHEHGWGSRYIALSSLTSELWRREWSAPSFGCFIPSGRTAVNIGWKIVFTLEPNWKQWSIEFSRLSKESNSGPPEGSLAPSFQRSQDYASCIVNLSVYLTFDLLSNLCQQ